jgi:ABC-type multidrug transport system fused ATPase/permease subunit
MTAPGPLSPASGNPAAPSPATRDTARRVVPLFRPYRVQVAAVIGLIVVTSTIGIINPLLIQVVFNQALFVPGGPNIQLLVILVAIMAVIPVVNGAIGVLQTYQTTRVGQQVMRDLRDRLYAHLQTLSLAFFTRTRTGEIQSRLANDVGGVQSVGTTTLSAANGRAGRADCRRSLRDVISSLALGKWPSGVCVRPPRQQSRVRELTNVQRTASCRKGRRSMTFACRSAPTSSMWRRGSAAASLEWSLSLE